MFFVYELMWIVLVHVVLGVFTNGNMQGRSACKGGWSAWSGGAGCLEECKGECLKGWGRLLGGM